jgi:cyclopropane fatty-acyl-phospholipid synthase-like methyltransferase
VQGDLLRGYPLADHDAHARSVAADAYWQQVRRTINGEPVDDAQIVLIVNAIMGALSLRKDDVVLDLACGNGALSSRLFDSCAGLVGVDLSPYLIEVAQRNFGRRPHYRFCLDDVVSYVLQERDASVFTKAVIYGAFQYFSRSDAAIVLRALHERFSKVAKVFIGNVPDKRRFDRFYRDRTPTEDELNDHAARLGVWYPPDEFEAIAQAAGWLASCSHMPAEFHASSYRFDVTLERVGS